MKINLIAIGKSIPTWVKQGYQEYAKRFSHHYQLNLIEIKEPTRSKSCDIQQLKQKEGQQLLAAVGKHDLVIALDVEGQCWDTHKLAQNLQAWHDDNQDISLLIGGPDGLSRDCLQAAPLKWSLSLLTLPHPLVRVVIAEQLYRAWSLNNNHPYHR